MCTWYNSLTFLYLILGIRIPGFLNGYLGQEAVRMNEVNIDNQLRFQALSYTA